MPKSNFDKFGTANPKTIETLELEPQLFRGNLETTLRGNRSVIKSSKFKDIKNEYIDLLTKAVVRKKYLGRPNLKWSVRWYAAQVVKNRRRYEQISKTTAVPWHVIGIIHALECNFSFQKHLFNGDSLKDYTKRYPPGHPKGLGKPPFKFNESAEAALEFDNFTHKKDWSTAKTLWRLERYNGMSYRVKLGMATPYLWSFTNHYSIGKFREVQQSNGSYKSYFDPKLVSRQCGAATILAQLIRNGDVAFKR